LSVFGKIIEVNMKCYFENCDNEASKCVKRKIIKGSVTKKSFWHCDKHSEDEINQEIECECLSVQMKNPFCDIKNLIKKN